MHRRKHAEAPVPSMGLTDPQEASMTDTFRPTSPRRARLVVASLLAGTMLAGGGLFAGHAWSANDSGQAPPTPAPVVVPPVNQAGFADLAAKVKSAVVNIATTQQVENPRSQAR